MYKIAKQNLARTTTLFFIVAAMFIAVGCSKAKGTQQPAPPPEVEVVQVEQKDVPIYSEWIGTLDGMVNAEIKAQVSGYLLRKNYTEGSAVKKGQLLFEIDPRPFQAALDQAKGELAGAEGQLAQANGQLAQANAQLLQAQANQGKTQLDVNRYESLQKTGDIPKQEYDNAVQANLAAKAQVKVAEAGIETAKAASSSARAVIEAAKASLQTAQLNLNFTRITSPIDGVAGIARAQVGDLVGPTTEPLATVSTVNPIKAYFTLSEQEYLSNTVGNPAQRGGNTASQNLELDMILVDGTTYPYKGKFFVADREVNTQTGSIRLAGVFPNPGNTLRPGQYARLRAVTSREESALLVPQRAVTELQGNFQVAVVDNNNTVDIRTIKTGERVGAMIIISEGLKPGEKVIAEGAQKVRPGSLVNPKPYEGNTATE